MYIVADSLHDKWIKILILMNLNNVSSKIFQHPTQSLKSWMESSSLLDREENVYMKCQVQSN